MHPRIMPQTLPQSMASAENLRTFCVTTPDMNAYQPIAASAVEVCAAAACTKARKADKLAAFGVDCTALLIKSTAHVPLSRDILKGLEIFEQQLDAMRRHIEQMPGKKANFLLGNKFKRENKRLKAELENQLYALLAAVAQCSRRVAQRMCSGTRFPGHPCSGRHLRGACPQFPEARGRHYSVDMRYGEVCQSNRDAAAELAKHTAP
ncbi:hypothetical protein B0H17DRAFT_553124 [Mycena rosella]|uniref:Uncharacterized protein n=1 Tax=Mycena rosella TaxID=1033263 RepID=A0AAD7DH58_MYCRO|nr:hypothetical protein B0H17DRAFT_553124 [Mycena rosella]